MAMAALRSCSRLWARSSQRRELPSPPSAAKAAHAKSSSAVRAGGATRPGRAGGTVATLPLNDGHTIPQVGLDTASLNDEQIASVIVAAIEAGYRHIDTAYRYSNQCGVGKGI